MHAPNSVVPQHSDPPLSAQFGVQGFYLRQAEYAVIDEDLTDLSAQSLAPHCLLVAHADPSRARVLERAVDPPPSSGAGALIVVPDADHAILAEGKHREDGQPDLVAHELVLVIVLAIEAIAIANDEQAGATPGTIVRLLDDDLPHRPLAFSPPDGDDSEAVVAFREDRRPIEVLSAREPNERPSV